MYLVKNDLLEIQQSKSVIEHSCPDCFQEIGYDLRIKEIYIPTKRNKKESCTLSSYDLLPGKTVFVGTIEDINMPLDMVGIIVQRNSRIRLGLQVTGPVYHPGHHTKVFLRVTNVSDKAITLAENDCIASIMFEKLSSEAEKYDGAFKDEFDYTALDNYKDLLRTSDIDEKMHNLEHIEKTLYEKVIVILTIFVGLFSLINLNINFLSGDEDLKQMLAYNLISIGSIGTLIGFIGLLINNKKYIQIVLTFGISFLFIVASIAILL